jgi:tRNA nucleotidyltransferase (CCA-adding enzyme)
LGKFIRIRVTAQAGAWGFDALGGNVVYSINYGEAITLPIGSPRPEGVFIMGLAHPIRYFDGRVIAIATVAGKTYAVTAAKRVRYIAGEILEAIRFYFDPLGEEIQINCLYERSCGAVVYRRADAFSVPEYLLIQNKRSMNWGFPKGHTEDDETPEQTAKREILEETGLTVELLPDFKGSSEYVIQGKVEKSVTIFLARAAEGELHLQEEEISQAAWMPFEEAYRTLKFENDKEILSNANTFLRRATAGGTSLR